ncbi:MAG: HlyD family efflux transporter periplasmic adaptor subunit [Reyranella sp.]|uniref:divalent metal ion exporter adaptor subunit IhpB n=1 Tax=Reyranella sp. TaxID=1929291 RepID=UPI001212939F|nr:efflux RND transporter periplasmic adaptor subunit [Reyranella sp.]TAJ90170.1 MAG: HlyD family efflux transporter periplasmic adaptor subunit [Reyranella sp.]TBR21673.1 MAG: HlyD family efflux transporter periplasmic adaptor subunit [Reyranella sp.]
MKSVKKALGYLAVAIVCAGILAAAGFYVFDSRFANQSKAASTKGGHGEKEQHGHDEGVKLTDAQIAAAGIELLTAGPRELRDTLQLNGTVQPNQETLVKVTPRFPGVIRSMRKRLGDKVKKDEVLATVESNQSLTVYELKAPSDGTVIDRDGTLGEFASEAKPIFTIADLSTMWVDFAVFRKDFSKVRLGDAVSIEVGDGGAPIEAKLDYLSPIGASDTQSAIARATVPNGGRLRPGLFVDGKVVLSARPVDVAVSASALQTLEGKNVVFVRSGDTFSVREVELGNRDADWVEVLFGLVDGDVYAARNSFVIKAEIGKAGAAHEH